MDSMTRFELDELSTLIVGVIALFVGRWIRQSVPFLRKIDMPNAVVGAMVVAVLVLLLAALPHFDVVFGSRAKDALLLIFFTSIGLSAKLAALKSGGKPLLILCAVTVAGADCAEPDRCSVGRDLGCAPRLWRAGGIALLRRRAGHGHGLGQGTSGAGTAECARRRRRRRDAGRDRGCLVAGPVTGWIVKRHKLHATVGGPSEVTFAVPDTQKPAEAAGSTQIESLLSTVFVLALAVLMGEKLNDWARHAGILLPGFLIGHDRRRGDHQPCRRSSSTSSTSHRSSAAAPLALQLFLVMALMSTPLISVAAILVPLVLNVVIQVVVTVAIAYFVLFRLLGQRLRRRGDIGRLPRLRPVLHAGRHGDDG